MGAKSLNIKQIRYFAAVVEHGSLSAAAKGQYVTVQAVSKAIADLERELGQRLFVRESRGVHPTPFGKAFYQKALPVLDDFGELEAFAKLYHESVLPDALRLALCSPAFYGYEQACASIALFANRGLGLDSTVMLETGTQGLFSLRAGDYDALITIGTLSTPDTDCMPVGTVAPGVVMSKSHPLAGQDEVSLADLSDYPIAVSQEFDCFNESIVAVYRRRKVDAMFVPIIPEKFDEHLEVHHGVCLMVHIPALGEMYPGTVIKPLASGDAVAIPLCLVSMKDRKSPAYLAFERWLASELIVVGGGGIASSPR